MFTAKLIIFILASIASLIFFVIAIFRYRMHKKRYPLAKGYKKLFKTASYMAVFLLWFLIIAGLIIYYAYLLFFRY